MSSPSRVHAALATILGSERAASATIITGNTVPPALVAFQLWGFTLNEWSAIAGIVFTSLLILGKIYQFSRWCWRQYVHRRAQRALLASLLPARTTPEAARVTVVPTPSVSVIVSADGNTPAFRQGEEP